MSEKDIRVLLVDDHAMVREGLHRVLQDQQGIVVVGTAADGQSALDQVRTLSADVVVMDVHLPGGSGIDISRQILAKFPAVQIVVLSGDSNRALVSQALEAGVSAYILKENASDELIQAIRSVMDHRVHLCPELASEILRDYQTVLRQKTIPVSKQSLTDRERQLLKLVAEGKRNKDIAAAMGVAVKSVETFRSRLMKKLGCDSANALTRYALREGITTL